MAKAPVKTKPAVPDEVELDGPVDANPPPPRVKESRVSAPAKAATKAETQVVTNGAPNPSRISLVKPVRTPGKPTPAKKGKPKTKAQIHKETFSEEGFRSGALHKATSAILARTMGGMREKFNDPSIGTAREAGKVIIGIPLPSLAMEYLLQSTVWPLSRVTQTVGSEGSFKSAFQWEIARWFRTHAAGLTNVFETEFKFSGEFAETFKREKWTDDDNLGHTPCYSVEDWQTKIQYWHTEIKDIMTGTKANPGSGRTFAVLDILDSLMGVLSEKTSEKIRTEGHAERRYPLEAQLITDFFKKFPGELAKWPISFNTVNHLKMRKDDQGNDVRSKAGGAQVSFEETYELQMMRRGKIYRSGISTKSAETFGLHLMIENYKNSLGQTGMKIPVDVVWWHERDSKGRPWQRTIFDWHASTIQFLLAQADEKGTLLRNVIKLNKATGDKVWCNELDISKEHPISFTKAGELLDSHTELKEALRDHFGIKRRPYFRPGVDYRKQLASEEARVAKEIAQSEDDALPT